MNSISVAVPAATAAIVLSMGMLVYETTQCAVESASAVDHSVQLLGHISALEGSLARADAAQRGFHLLVEAPFIAERMRANAPARSAMPGVQQLQARQVDGFRDTRLTVLAAMIFLAAIVALAFVLNRRAERARFEAERRVYDLAESLPGAVFQYRLFPDGGARYELLSRNTREVRGVDPEAALRDPGAILDTVLEADRPVLLRSIAQSAEDLSPLTIDYRVHVGGKLKWIRSTSAPRRDKDGSTLWSGHWDDVSTQRALEEELLRAKETADAASRTKSTFLATMSHEIRTPMNGVLATLELLSLTRLDGEQRAMLGIVRESGTSLLRIIDDITRMTLTVELPIARGDAAAAPPRDEPGIAVRAAPTVEEAERANRLLLLVDDHAVNRTVLLRQVNALGYAAETAQNGREALAKWSSGRFAAVITDCSMPEMSGYELARTIRDREKDTPRKRTVMIACTGYALDADAAKCFEAGMDEYLVKPFSLEQLSAKRSKWFPPQGARETPDNFDPPLDHAMIAEISGGDGGLARELLSCFVHYNAIDAGRLREAFIRRDPVGITECAHRIKGAARAIGANSLAALCEAIEGCAESLDTQGASAALRRFDMEVGTLHDYISNHPEGAPHVDRP